METVYEVVTLLVDNRKIRIITLNCGIITINFNDGYDTDAIIDYLTEHLDGTNTADFVLSDYVMDSVIPQLSEAFESEGQTVTAIIDGTEVEGMFFPKKQKIHVTSDKGTVEIPKLDSLEDQIARAKEDGSPSVVNFLKRLADVIHERKHSAEDLMDFVKRSELPLTASGKIIAYKRVKSARSSFAERGVADYYVDCHTGNISQRIGSRVITPKDSVNTDRDASCAVGLHVANLDYLSTFQGTHTLVVLVDPADFITVPHEETAKARVCAYTVVGVLTDGDHRATCSGKTVKSDEFKELISSLVSGNDVVQPNEEVLVKDARIKKVTKLTVAVVEPNPEGKSYSGSSLRDTKVSKPEPKKEGSKKVSVLKKMKKSKSLAQQAAELYKEFIKVYDVDALKELHNFKRKKKISYDRLGFSTAQIQVINRGLEAHKL